MSKSSDNLLPLLVIAGLGYWWFTQQEAKAETPPTPTPTTRDERRRILLAMVGVASLATLQAEKLGTESAIATGSSLPTEVMEDLRWGLDQIKKRITELGGRRKIAEPPGFRGEPKAKQPPSRPPPPLPPKGTPPPLPPKGTPPKKKKRPKTKRNS
jgi:hypothetical protein